MYYIFMNEYDVRSSIITLVLFTFAEKEDVQEEKQESSSCLL